MWERFIGAFDVHGDKQDPRAVEPFFKFCDIWKPHTRFFGGDAWDFRPLRGKANDDEKRESMRVDFEAGLEFIKRFKPNYFIRGNHDERLWELAESGDGVRTDYARIGTAQIEKELKEMNCRMLPYHKSKGVLRLGHLKILHGFFCGVYAARQHALVYGSCLFGHVHDITEHSIPRLERSVARACGCLCELDMPYAARTPNTLRQAHGWPYGVINTKTGHYHVFQAEKVAGKFITAEGVIEL